MFSQVLERFQSPSARAERTGRTPEPAPEIRPFTAAHPGEAASSRRRYRRWSVNLSGDLSAGRDAFHCAVYDISPSGARVQVSQAHLLSVGQLVLLDLEVYGVIPAEVRHVANGFVGLRFTYDAEAETEFARHLVAAKPPRRRGRQAVRSTASLRASACELPCLVANISRTGAAVHLDETRHIEPGGEVTLKLPEHAPLQALVRYVDGNTVGLRLIDPYLGA
jgi:hypothetical protein